MMIYTLCCHEKPYFVVMEKKTYAKRYGNEDFAVPIRCYEWAEVFELIAP